MSSESDLDKDPANGEEAKKSSGKILQDEVSEALIALNRSTRELFISGLSAGLDIGFSLLLIAVVRTAAEGVLSPPVTQLLLAPMYAFGFLIVVLGRSELFTEQTTLAVLPLLKRDVSIFAVLRLWAIVFVSNIIGTACFALLMATAVPEMGLVDREVLGKIAVEVVSHSFWVIFVSGILAGWMMGLLSWLVAAGRDTISQIVIVLMITSGIGLAHLHHCVLGSVEVLAGLFAGGDLTMLDYGRFLLWATLGNAFGGSFFVAFIKSGHARPATPSTTQ